MSPTVRESSISLITGELDSKGIIDFSITRESHCKEVVTFLIARELRSNETIGSLLQEDPTVTKWLSSPRLAHISRIWFECVSMLWRTLGIESLVAQAFTFQYACFASRISRAYG